MKENRKISSIRNLMFGIVYQIVNLILSFVCRTILIKKLGSEILGINSLYTNILTLLSLAELGISNVMLVKLYKPIVDDDKVQISAYINYYKKVYRIIVGVILVIGISIIPLLGNIVSSDVSIEHREVITYYLIFLLNTVISYFAVYKQALLNANQEYYIIKIFNFINIIVRSLSGIILLLLFENYKLYLISECVCNVLINLIISIYVDKKYPYLRKYKAERLQIGKRKELVDNVKDTFLYKIGSVIISNTDSLIVSIMISTVVVGYLSNYNLVITALNGIITIITGALFASVGNLAVENNPEKSNKIFNIIIGIYHYIGAFFAIGLFCCFNDFILLWLNSEEFILDTLTVAAISFNFYFMTSITPVYIFRENYGLFKKAKYYLLMAAAVNIIASYIFIKLFGVGGVILGTIVCRLVTTFILEPPYLYKTIFKASSKSYFLRQFVMMIVSMISFLICYFICGFLATSWINFIIKIMVCFIVVSSLFIISFFKTQEFVYLKNMLKEIIIKIKGKKQKNADS